MSANSCLRGHPIHWDEQDSCWRFSDTDEPTAEVQNQRPCGHCGRHDTPEGHDGCLGTLPGVMNACCGHGKNELAYVQYPPGDYIVRGMEATAHIRDLKALRGD